MIPAFAFCNLVNGVRWHRHHFDAVGWWLLLPPPTTTMVIIMYTQTGSWTNCTYAKRRQCCCRAWLARHPNVKRNFIDCLRFFLDLFWCVRVQKMIISICSGGKWIEKKTPIVHFSSLSLLLSLALLLSLKKRCFVSMWRFSFHLLVFRLSWSTRHPCQWILLFRLVPTGD